MQLAESPVNQQNLDDVLETLPNLAFRACGAERAAVVAGIRGQRAKETHTTPTRRSGDRMRRPGLLILALAFPTALVAQQPASGQTRDGVMYAFANFADIYGSRLVAALDSIPADRYDYRPTPSQQTIGYIAQHIEAANYGLCERLGDQRHPATATDSVADSVKARWPKDTLVARLRASLRFCDMVMDQMPSLASGSQARTLLAFETDLAEHYSQLAGYMRQLGMVPPTALPPRQRVAIELPTSALRAFVGVYQLSPDLQLDVTLRDSGLFVQSTGGATVRLWPEGDRDFFLKDLDAQVTFVRDGGGAVTGLVVHQYGRDRSATKLR
jgi:hypothetical protein